MYIYMIKNKLDKKVYIGQTKNLKGRFDSHIQRSNDERNTHHLYSAMRKYGIENFEFSMIEECDETIVDEREIFWISEYKSNDQEIGYNLTEGGKSNRGWHHTNEFKKLMSERQKGKPRSDKVRRKISQSKMGHEVTDESREKMSKSHKGKKLDDVQKHKIGKSLLGHECSEESRLKISLANTGKKRTPEQRKRNSDAQKVVHQMKRKEKLLAVDKKINDQAGKVETIGN